MLAPLILTSANLNILLSWEVGTDVYTFLLEYFCIFAFRSPVTDSDEEDSAESSTDDEAGEEPSQEGGGDDRYVVAGGWAAS